MPSTNYTSGSPVTTTTTTIAAFTPIGLLLVLTYAAAVTVTATTAIGANYTKQTINSTNYT